MTYNMTSIATSGGLLEFTQGVNTVLMDGFLGILLLLGIGFILLSGFYWGTRDMRTAFSGTMFIMFLMSLMLRAVDLIPTAVIFVTLVGCAISIAFTWKQ